MVGNIGYSFARQIALEPKDIYVIEVSSFQLDDIKTFAPDVAILLNITEDHLDRYENSMLNYIQSKFRIAMNQNNKQYFIYNYDDENITNHLQLLNNITNPLTFSMKHESKNGGHVSADQMKIRMQEERINMSVDDFALQGQHNQQNTMAACIAANCMGIRKESIRKAVASFEGLEHRMEFVATVRGVEFINDSKSTNVNSTWFALESMKKKVILILGGQDKGNDYTILNNLVKDKVKAIVCMGKDNSKIIAAYKKIAPTIKDTHSLKDAVAMCFKLADKDDVVLLSPACASFDLFNNFEERGKLFKQAVKEL
jgi:UDP-N-acetylmuramoylalanine--D-glutamate ligase